MQRNDITTSKYTILTFLPINLFEQFRRVANAYFLFLLILQCIPQINALNPISTAVPLVIVLGITAAKDGVDDYKRHQSDRKINNREATVLQNGSFQPIKWKDVKVGDIVRIENNQHVPADILLLSTSEASMFCFIETADLDGETNLKIRQPLAVTGKIGVNEGSYVNFTATLQSELPNNRLNKYQGTLEYNGETYAIDNDKILLRGCVLRNTKQIYGTVVFTGKDTKLMQNSGSPRFKRTRLDRVMNSLVLLIFVILCCFSLIGAILGGLWEGSTGQYFRRYLPWETYTHDPASIGALLFLSYIILLNTLVPISLYVRQIIRLGQSWTIDWDIKMYHEKTDTPAKARTTTLNEELGQIEYIFSDKTGTLTQNVMTFNRCSILGTVYGQLIAIELSERSFSTNKKVDFSANRFCTPKFEFFDQNLLQDCHDGIKDVQEFFRLLALCHTVMAEESEGELVYKSQSPDEAALVEAARNFGFVFTKRSSSMVILECLGQEEQYELLCTLDFNNVRKRMSVIVRHGNEIVLYCKGADTVIYERLEGSSPDVQSKTTDHLNSFAGEGLRTLCLAKKIIDPKFYTEWKVRHHAANTATIDRDEKLDAVYEEIEQNLTLIGATAIEDKLQDGVPETIANLTQANIKIWVLTGDKQETAINIGYSCRLLTESMDEVFIINGNNLDSVRSSIENFQQRITDIKGQPRNENNAQTSQEDRDVFGLVINGDSLAYALADDLKLTFLNLASQCNAIICCRVTPLQKALVVKLVKDNKNAVTLAIGDGANDVSMIKEAHIGVGISGQEGMQAVMSTIFFHIKFKTLHFDLFFNDNFKFLERLLLVHGRWDYMRMCKFLNYFFYKNFAFTLCHFWFGIFSGFSAQAIYDSWFVTLYNVVFTSLPVIGLAILEQDVNDKYSIRHPQMYVPGQQNVLFNEKIFMASLFQGVCASLALFFIPYLALYMGGVDYNGITLDNLQFLGTVIAFTLVIVVNLQIALYTKHWNVIMHVFIWVSMLSFVVYAFIFYSYAFFSLSASQFNYVRIHFQVFSNPYAWFVTAVATVFILTPSVLQEYYNTTIRPSLTERIRWQQINHGDIDDGSLHSATVKRRRSTHSGFAFSQEPGISSVICADNPNTRSTPVPV
ncbi:uncharacterized protein TRIADDRAFT_23045 [Trichoplax adhaerens]|uniref:Phospholipid-transporting ATPase n=1 Tax=Trichoplax adhaerens TaxID=10228 RepID=B3RSC3_TRIAD|nr:hypothetical protein TRIADDRAFT_23045 [Trichoplax adhaerens]EDV26490.1 hypothetical protein TRIADDRAFT_23045 [Trichoplax adhaerens]|eukprot:XP_002110486.1 hypothetical protein TRIADDRAFT_23045 [Trichoplax adhaerens]